MAESSRRTRTFRRPTRSTSGACATCCRSRCLGAERSTSEGLAAGHGRASTCRRRARRYDGEPGAEMTISDMGGVQGALVMGADVDDGDHRQGDRRRASSGRSRSTASRRYETYDSERRRGEIQTRRGRPLPGPASRRPGVDAGRACARRSRAVDAAGAPRDARRGPTGVLSARLGAEAQSLAALARRRLHRGAGLAGPQARSGAAARPLCLDPPLRRHTLERLGRR